VAGRNAFSCCLFFSRVVQELAGLNQDCGSPARQKLVAHQPRSSFQPYSALQSARLGLLRIENQLHVLQMVRRRADLAQPASPRYGRPMRPRNLPNVAKKWVMAHSRPGRTGAWKTHPAFCRRVRHPDKLRRAAGLPLAGSQGGGNRTSAYDQHTSHPARQTDKAFRVNGAGEMLCRSPPLGISARNACKQRRLAANGLKMALGVFLGRLRLRRLFLGPARLRNTKAKTAKMQKRTTFDS